VVQEIIPSSRIDPRNPRILSRIMPAGIMSPTRKQVIVRLSAMKIVLVLIDGVTFPDVAGAYDPLTRLNTMGLLQDPDDPYYAPADGPAPTR
jgi:hypothetical protein